MKRIQISIRLTPDQLDRLALLSEQDGQGVAAIARAAIDHYVHVRAGGAPEDRRRQFISEYMFLVCDRIAQDQFADAQADMIAEAQAMVGAA